MNRLVPTRDKIIEAAMTTARPRAIQMDWGIESIVAELRVIRDESLEKRRRLGKPVKLPSPKALQAIVESLAAALFPNRLGARILASQSVDYYVGHLLDVSFRDLSEQVDRELKFAETSSADESRRQAVSLVKRFGAELPAVRGLLESDIQATYRSDPAAKNVDEVLACYPGILAVIYHRLANVLYRLGSPIVARMITEIAHSQTGIDIHPGATIGSSFVVDHGTGVVIGETATIGSRVHIDHGVTLGAARSAGGSTEGSAGLPPATLPRHPRVEDDVVIYAGATLLGPITIGRGAVIGGNVWLTHSVPPGSVVTQADLRREEFDAGSGI